MFFKSLVLMRHFLSQSFWDWVSILFMTYVITFLFKAEELYLIGVLLGLMYKEETFVLHKSWYEYLFFHKSLFFIGAITFCEWMIGSMMVIIFLSLNECHSLLWSLFLANILILKMGLSVIAQAHFSSTALRSLSCLILTPWFIILKAGLETESLMSVCLLLGLLCCLIGLTACFGRLLLQWSFLPFEWTLENEK